MPTTTDFKKVFKKDGEGNAYRIQQTVYKGQIINYEPPSGDLAVVLDQLPLMKSRRTDVWLLTHPKSGSSNSFNYPIF